MSKDSKEETASKEHTELTILDEQGEQITRIIKTKTEKNDYNEDDNVINNVGEFIKVVINKPEKLEELVEVNDILNTEEKILKAPTYANNERYNVQADYQQAAYFQQQSVAGQPVYVLGAPPPPVDAARMPPYCPGNEASTNDFDYEDTFGLSFDNRYVRHRFVQRVYSILTVQLLYTVGFIMLCKFIPSVNYFVRNNLPMFIAALVVELIISFAILCCVSARRNFPLNFILLGIFTLAFAYLAGYITTYYSTYIIMTAMGITAGVTLLISIFAIQTSCDITSWGMYLCIGGVVLFIFGIISIIVTYLIGGKIMFLIYSSLGALLFSLYLMYDTQQIMGGRRYELSPEEYICGAFCLYVDIMYIFISIMNIIGLSSSN